MNKLLIAVLVTITAGLISWYFLPTRSPIPEQTRWYQMIWHGENVGYMREDYRLEGRYFKIINETHVNTISQGQPYRFSETKRLVFASTAPFQFLSSHYSYKTDEQLIQTTLEYVGDQLAGTRRVNNATNSVHVATEPLYLKDFRQLNQWVANGPDSGATLTYTIPDLTTANMETAQYELISVDSDSFTARRFSASDATEREIILDAQGEAQAYHYGDIISLVRVVAETDIVTAGDVDLYVSKLLALDAPLGAFDTLKYVEMTLPDWLLPYVESDNRQSINNTTLTLRADVSAVAEHSDSKDVPNYRFNKNTEQQLLKLAQRAVAQKDAPLEQLTALRAYVSDYMADGARVSVTSIESLLENPVGDCTEHTQLFNALARVLGYQARTVNGLVYLGDESRGFAGHQWSEVLVNGYWLSFDPTWNRNSLTATHIRLDQQLAAELYRKIKANNDSSLALINKY